MPQHLTGIAGQLHGLGHVAPGPAVVFGFIFGIWIIFYYASGKAGLPHFFVMFC